MKRKLFEKYGQAKLWNVFRCYCIHVYKGDKIKRLYHFLSRPTTRRFVQPPSLYLWFCICSYKTRSSMMSSIYTTMIVFTTVITIKTQQYKVVLQSDNLVMDDIKNETMQTIITGTMINCRQQFGSYHSRSKLFWFCCDEPHRLCMYMTRTGRS